MILQDIIHIIESVAPLSYQEQWDNSGLQVGNRNADITAALLTIDITESVVLEAVEKQCNLIVSHHPLLFHGLKHLTDETPQERCVEMAIRHGIAIYSSHTAMDSYLHGVSGRMAEHIGISQYTILSPSADNPHIGLGVIGTLEAPMEANDFIRHTYHAFHSHTMGIRYIPPCRQTVHTVALCGGAGAELLDIAITQGADIYISADFKYHEMQAAVNRIGVIELDHWVSEQFTRDIFQEILSPHITVHISQKDHSPVQYIADNTLVE